ncbi:MAG: tyrosine-type recombinase/integrase [Stenomitos frigidus ULC029]
MTRFDQKPADHIPLEIIPLLPREGVTAPALRPTPDRGTKLPDVRSRLIDGFLSSSSFRANTRRAYATELSKLLVWSDTQLEGRTRHWQDFTARDLARYKAHVKALKTDAAGVCMTTSVNASLTAIKSFYKWLCEARPELITQNPTVGLKFERVPLPPAQAISTQALQWVWAALEYGQHNPPRDRALVSLLSHGLRANEVVSLNLAAYDQEQLFLANTKTYRPRTVPLEKAAQQAVNDYLSWRQAQGEVLGRDSPLLLAHGNKPLARLTYSGLYAAVKRLGYAALPLYVQSWLDGQPHEFDGNLLQSAVKRLHHRDLSTSRALMALLPRECQPIITALSELHPHQFRHTFATTLMREGLDPTFVRVLLGHTSEQSTKRYTRAIEGEAAIAAFKRIKGE